MKRIPPEIDSLMWAIAENPGDDAIEEFGRRFPDYRQELAKRLSMVRALKGARAGVPSMAPTRWQPDRPARRAPGRFRLGWVLASAALAAVAFASYAGFSALATRQTEIPPVPSVPTAPPAMPDRIVYREAPRPIDPAPPIAPPPSRPRPPWDQPISLQMEGVPLEVALQAIAQKGGLRLEIAPGLSEVLIVLDYRETRPMDILRDMGPKFGFTALPQGRNEVLIVPVVSDPTGPAPEQPTDRVDGNVDLGRTGL
ncbi:MAG: hypothetical protein SNJ74_01345 [Fimbriimonadaceae bacterium]